MSKVLTILDKVKEGRFLKELHKPIIYGYPGYPNKFSLKLYYLF